MTITKYGQCCLLIEVEGKRILTDPGKFTSAQNELSNIDLILITHEHSDHLHSESLHATMANNPQALIVTNSAVGNILEKLGVAYEILEGRDSMQKAGIRLEAFEGKHVEIFEEYGQVQNTGYFIADRLFYPGDAYTEPGKSVEILALPVAGPWCCSADALAYAVRVKPTKAFPVHDWLLNEDGIALMYGLCENILSEQGIDFVPLHTGDTQAF